jgi:hypothetical protein
MPGFGQADEIIFFQEYTKKVMEENVSKVTIENFLPSQNERLQVKHHTDALGG